MTFRPVMALKQDGKGCAPPRPCKYPEQARLSIIFMREMLPIPLHQYGNGQRKHAAGIGMHPLPT
ncbi:MAG: hypothetical protein J5855_06655 [Mailhella sp.]|nr:hypothetical protein [Mailhella sp.]